MPSVVTFGQLPNEEPAFIAYLLKSGDIWARAGNDDPNNPRFEPASVSEFLDRFARQIIQYHVVTVCLGSRQDILNPAVRSHEMIEGGTQIPFVQFGKVVPGVHTIVGGTKSRRLSIDPMGSSFILYSRGEFRRENQLAMSNLCYYSGSFRGQEWVKKPQTFLKWAKKVLDWMRRRTPELVQVYQCNYENRATKGVARAAKNGLKLY